MEHKQAKSLENYPINKLKKCSKCKQTYLATSKFFYKHRNRKDGFDPWCKECKKKYHESYYILKKYKLTGAEYRNMLEEQDNRCGICGVDFDYMREIRKDNVPKSGNPRIDHNHQTGEIRGLLCDDCNLVLGFLKDNAFYLINAAKYLQNHKK